MPGLYVPLDAEYQADPKIIRAGAYAELLYVRGLALAKRLLDDGRIDRAQLAGLALGIPGKAATHAAALVTEGLWVETCTGWVISGWTKRNPSRAEVEAKRDQKRQAGIKGNHQRHHIDAGRSDPACPLCVARANHLRSQAIAPSDRTGSHPGDTAASPKPETKPEPEPYLDPTPPTDTPSDPSPGERIMHTAATAMARDDLARRPEPPDNPDAWLTTVTTRHLAENRTAWQTRLAEHPDLSSRQLAEGASRPPSDTPEAIDARARAELEQTQARIAELHAVPVAPGVPADVREYLARRRSMSDGSDAA